MARCLPWVGANDCVSRSATAVDGTAVQDKSLSTLEAERKLGKDVLFWWVNPHGRWRRRPVIDGALDCRDSVCCAFRPKKRSKPFYSLPERNNVSAVVLGLSLGGEPFFMLPRCARDDKFS